MLMRQEPLDLSELESAATGLQRDPLPHEMYLDAEAVETKDVPALVEVKDLESALLQVDRESGVRVRRRKADGLLEASGLARRKVRFAATVDLLEALSDARPLSPFDDGLWRLAEKLDKAGERLPLVVGSFQQGAFRTSVAYWVQNRKSTTVHSVAQLRKKIDAWNGECPGPEEWQQALRRQ